MKILIQGQQFDITTKSTCDIWSKQWASGFLLADLLMSLSKSLKSISCLELGCGLGVVSLCIFELLITSSDIFSIVK